MTPGATPALRPRPIVLVGMRGSGKTSVGARLASLAGRPFRDLDEETRTLARLSGQAPSPGCSVGELFAAVGETAFRELEAWALRRLLEPQVQIVLAAGGGTVERADNRAWLRRGATSVWLRVEPGLLRERLAADATLRPPLRGEDALGEIEAVLRSRAGLFEEVADLAIDCGGRGVEELAAEIFHALAVDPPAVS